jgi:hypothetical protein
LRTVHAHKPDDRLLERIGDFAHIAPCNLQHIERSAPSCKNPWKNPCNNI